MVTGVGGGGLGVKGRPKNFGKDNEAHLPLAGSAGGVASCCRGRWRMLTIGGLEPLVLAYQPMVMTTGPPLASCAV